MKIRWLMNRLFKVVRCSNNLSTFSQRVLFIAKDEDVEKTSAKTSKAYDHAETGLEAPADPSEVGPSLKHPKNVLAKEILANLKNFPHCILLTRVGQFYEACSLLWFC